jgi:hypothetical protein
MFDAFVCVMLKEANLADDIIEAWAQTTTCHNGCLHLPTKEPKLTNDKLGHHS